MGFEPPQTHNRMAHSDRTTTQSGSRAELERAAWQAKYLRNFPQAILINQKLMCT